MTGRVRTVSLMAFIILCAVALAFVSVIYRHPERRYVNAYTKGKWETAFDMLDKGADVNRQDPFGRNVLYYASYDAPLEVVKKFVSRGADYKTIRAGERLPITIAASEFRWEIVKYFLSLNETFPDYINRDVLLYAIAAGQVEIASIFVDQGVSVEFYSVEGYTPLHIALTSQLLYAHPDKMESVVEFLLQNGANPNSPARKKSSTVESHVGNKAISAAQLNEDTRTPLQMALPIGNDQITSLLKKYGTKK